MGRIEHVGPDSPLHKFGAKIYNHYGLRERHRTMPPSSSVVPLCTAQNGLRV